MTHMSHTNIYESRRQTYVSRQEFKILKSQIAIQSTKYNHYKADFLEYLPVNRAKMALLGGHCTP